MSSLLDFADDVRCVRETIDDLPAAIAALRDVPPAGGNPPQLVLDLAVSLWRDLGFPNPGATPGVAVSVREDMADRVRLLASNAPDAFAQLSATLDALITGALADGETGHAEIIRTRDFGQVFTYGNPEEVGLSAKKHVLGLRASLKPGHVLLRLLAEEECFHVDGGAAVVLGLAAPTAGPSAPRARAWYLRPEAIALTRSWGAMQRRKDHELKAAEEAERVRREELWRESPQGEAAALRRKVADLEREMVALRSAKP